MTVPTGTVTFLFTDIEGSTKLARSYPEIWESLRERHTGNVNDAKAIYQETIQGWQEIGNRPAMRINWNVSVFLLLPMKSRNAPSNYLARQKPCVKKFKRQE